VATFSEEILNAEYQIEILTESGHRIEIFARLVRVDGPIAGFQTLQIAQESQKVIQSLVFEYETTNDFIQQLDEFDLLNDKVVDEDGNEIEITFEKDSHGKA